MLSARWRRWPFCLQRNTTSRENPKESLTRYLQEFLSERWANAVSCKRTSAAQRRKRVREAAALAARGLWNYFLREPRNFYPISTAASGIKRLCACVSMGFRKMFTWKRNVEVKEKERERGGRRERERADGKLHTPLASNWILEYPHGLWTLARDVKPLHTSE